MKRTQYSIVALTLIIAGLTLFLAACSPSGSSLGLTNQETPVLSKYNLNAYPMNKIICDPFTGQPQLDLEKGIKASLYPKLSTQPIWHSANDYINHYTKADQTLFFADFNIPTRSFQLGFTTAAGETLKDDLGYRLMEYFAVEFETDFMLANTDEETNYEFALLSDDGSKLQIQENGVWKDIINNDGDHQTRMGCSTQVLNLKKNQKIPMRVQYYQGP